LRELWERVEELVKEKSGLVSWGTASCFQTFQLDREVRTATGLRSRRNRQGGIARLDSSKHLGGSKRGRRQNRSIAQARIEP